MISKNDNFFFSFFLFSVQIPKKNQKPKSHGPWIWKFGQNRRQTATYVFDPGSAGVEKTGTNQLYVTLRPWGPTTLVFDQKIGHIWSFSWNFQIFHPSKLKTSDTWLYITFFFVHQRTAPPRHVPTLVHLATTELHRPMGFGGRLRNPPIHQARTRAVSRRWRAKHLRGGLGTRPTTPKSDGGLPRRSTMGLQRQRTLSPRQRKCARRCRNRVLLVSTVPRSDEIRPWVGLDFECKTRYGVI